MGDKVPLSDCLEAVALWTFSFPHGQDTAEGQALQRRSSGCKNNSLDAIFLHQLFLEISILCRALQVGKTLLLDHQGI